MILKRKLNLEIGIGLDVGQTRKGKPNQDAVGCVLPGILKSRPPLFILADGMGGHNGGDIASHTVVKVVKRCYRYSRVNDSPQVIETLIQEAHEEIKALGLGTPALSLMGTGKEFYFRQSWRQQDLYTKSWRNQAGQHGSQCGCRSSKKWFDH